MKWKDIKNLIEKELNEEKLPANVKKIPKELDKSSKMHADQSKALAKASKLHKNQAKRLRKAGVKTEGTSSFEFPGGGGGTPPTPIAGAGGSGKISPKLDKNPRKIKEASVTAKDTKFNLRVGVNKNPTKLGVKVQFEPSSGIEMDRDTKAALEIALQENLNKSLVKYGIQVSKDTDVPRLNVIGFFIPLAQIKNLIVEALGGPTEEPTVPAPEPETEPASTQTAPPTQAAPEVPTTPSPEQMVNEQLINEMRVRDLNEISKVINKNDFYEFINAGNNIVRTLEENGIDRPKKYLEYLTKHNIM
tara:strand:+ start:550 stop:1461 length:912 start_codon:yes stop_codon:yes gene_type:complete